MKSKDSEFIREKWFKPREFYAKGFPRGIVSYLQKLPGVKEGLIEAVQKIECKSALEIGPGKQPIIKGVPKHVFLDISKYFLNGREITKGAAFLGKAQNLPFKDNSFDAVVANDVLVHMRPQDRVTALKEMARVTMGAVIIFEYETRAEDGRMMSRYLDNFEGPWIDLEQLKTIILEAGMAILDKRHYFFTSRLKKDKLEIVIIAEIITAIKT